MSQFYGANPNVGLSSFLSKLSPGFSDNIYKELENGFGQVEFAEQLEELERMAFNNATLRANQPMSIGGIDAGGGPNPGPPPSISPSFSFSPSFSTPEPPSPYSPSGTTGGTSGTSTDKDSTSSTVDSDSDSTSSSSSTPNPDTSTPDSKGDSTSPSIGPDSEDPVPTISPPWPPPPKSTSEDPEPDSSTYVPPDPPTPDSGESTGEETTDPKDCIPIGGGTITPRPPTSFSDLPKEDCGPDCPCCDAEPASCCADAWADCVTLTCLYHKEKCTCTGAIHIQFCSSDPEPSPGGHGSSPVAVGINCCEGNDDCQVCLTTKYAYTWDITCSIACWNSNCPMSGTVDTTTCKPCCDGY